ncbi:uncharacterized protein LOC143228689 isoform X2 [Tachypleus tridentatus]|uniref:uncharacterized protein LOC143228689 isoform X2 n=1 Tax=Tachypleus tridentatus TaxID=6853 RepID=UPI003FCF861F
MYCYGNNNPWKFSKSLDVSSWKFKDMERSESSSFRPLSNTNSELSENTKTSNVKKSVIPEDKFNTYSTRMPKHQDQDKRLKDFDELMLKYQKQILCESLQAQLDPSILHFVKDILQLELPETDDHVNARDESGTKNSVSDEESSRFFLLDMKT